MPKPRLIIDCDPGHDDAIALILAHRHAEVIGITTVSGNAPLDATTANALMVTALLGVDTPVHRGAAKPLVGEPAHAAAVHGESGLGGVARIAHARQADSDDAVGFLLDSADEALWVVAVGPLTNLALALERDPSWGRRLAGISIMGGSTDIGNVTRVAEFNIFADPEAAARVFHCGARLTMCGLNLTRQLRSNDALADRLTGPIRRPILRRPARPHRTSGSRAPRPLRGAGRHPSPTARNPPPSRLRGTQRHPDPRHDRGGPTAPAT